MTRVFNEIFTLDNLWHSLAAAGFVVILGILSPVPPFALAVLAGIALYLREAWQVDWDWTLRWSRHKHMEWVVGTIVGFSAAVVMEIM